MLAFVYLATLVATFSVPATLAVPTSTNTGLYPRETSGTYKVYLNADSFEGTDGEGDGATNEETLCFQIRLTEFSDAGETILSGPTDGQNNCNENLSGKYTYGSQWWLVNSAHPQFLVSYTKSAFYFTCDGTSDTATCVIHFDDIAEGTNAYCTLSILNHNSTP
ncbi:hypothetical protein PILCRDRAFT_826107 [Piloderma croceum F 1598]|uniref:AA1-like domain-containing protein n=1 Tax=Piloderma croceum (strain F 1598) TaxID=765440 RepID=A0A0C3EW20_PILCF|nr:hypothetical protein PILCRDRAFT_826107 [Piloderma croceum F 1598]